MSHYDCGVRYFKAVLPKDRKSPTKVVLYVWENSYKIGTVNIYTVDN